MRKASLQRRTQTGALLVLVLAAGLLSSCTTAPPTWYQPPPKRVIAEQIQLSYVMLADLRAVEQLGDGWYEIEDGAWRWMGREATLYLKRPEGENVLLEARLFVPGSVIRRVGAPSIQILLNGELLITQNFPQAGAYVIEQAVPPEKLHANLLRVDLKLDRALPPSIEDQRQLGIVVKAVGFRENSKS